LTYNFPKTYEESKGSINFHEADGFLNMSQEDDDERVGEVAESNQDISGILEDYAKWAESFSLLGPLIEEKKE
jgi:hypothetical protein